MRERPVWYMQTDPRWANVDYSAPGEKTTIRAEGCGPTSVAMVVATLVDPSETPLKAAKWALQHGYKALRQGTYYSFFVPYFKKFGLICRQLTTSSVYHNPKATVHKRVLQELRKGNLIIACMGKGIWTTSGHYVLAYAVDDRRVYINDPWSRKDMCHCNLIETWQNQVKHYWVIEIPQKEKEDDEVIEKKKIAIMGHDVEVENIFKNDKNFSSIRDVCEAIGCEITSEGKEPIISAGTVKMKINDKEKVLSGFNSGGTVYVAVRPFAELLGKSVGWDSEENRVIIE